MNLKEIDKAITKLQGQRRGLLEARLNELAAEQKAITSQLGSTARKAATVRKVKKAKTVSKRAHRGELLVAIKDVLQAAGKPLHYTEIFKAVAEKSLSKKIDQHQISNAVYSYSARAGKTGICTAGKGTFALAATTVTATTPAPAPAAA